MPREYILGLEYLRGRVALVEQGKWRHPLDESQFAALVAITERLEAIADALDKIERILDARWR